MSASALAKYTVYFSLVNKPQCILSFLKLKLTCTVYHKAMDLGGGRDSKTNRNTNYKDKI